MFVTAVEYPIRCPQPFQRLPELAYNLWWSWQAEAQALFEYIDATHWRRHRNPVKLLHERGAALRKLARDVHFLAMYDDVMRVFDGYMNEPDTWHARMYPRYQKSPVAYFCAEFGFHECLPIYCGGLGVLAGDHTKSASDLGVPFVGVGLLYKNGYFTQRIDAKGHQVADYPNFDFANLPVLPLRRRNGQPLQISVELCGRRVFAKGWLVNVGRAQVILLDADTARNTPKDRRLTAQLYGGDRDTRISQEIILGMGGVRALRALGISPAVWHLNEGHAAFVLFERIAELRQKHKLDFDHAAEIVASDTVFTTHTPVAAGNEAFSLPLMDKYFRRFCKENNIELPRLLNLGLQVEESGYKFFSMTVLALRLSSGSNGVSRLHGEVSRQLWKHLWPNVPSAETPIASITNGVHAETWMALEMAELFARHLGRNWRAHLNDTAFWEKARRIPDGELWRVHRHLKMRLIDFARQRLSRQLQRHGASTQQIKAAAKVLHPEALTIGFARRFASYKRADLIFSDLKRLEKLVNNKKQPVQIIFAGKAHPQDRDGQAILRRVFQMTQRKRLKGKVILLEDYDMNVGRHLVQGVDVWLNNPRRPMEASGTSGQKVPLNGGINCSILDGWWAEGYDGENGWAIGKVIEGRSDAEQDRADARALYEVLEKHVIPSFYRRDRDGLPKQWLKKAKISMATLIPRFNTETMVRNYVEKLYEPARRRGEFVQGNRFANAAALTRVKDYLRQQWPLLHITDAAMTTSTAKRGARLNISAGVYLGALPPHLVQVEACAMAVQQNGALEVIEAMPLQQGELNGDGVCRYKLELSPPPDPSRQWRLRVLPHHPALGHKHELGLILWRDL
ncbi:MAG: alpha-glucan family phosphorylase [candidate division KSB1 bacterium]|nr:alpha-glucan family phosphorylase [candidate division KSB1 bacterium]MDZ7366132.1 alpha-glucan family phosphorylase [candidate division KSB1 bacterium]MDZ7404226.1 alpha-glucan family phosphorylase [candidate division KSB1 bacterium]